MLTVLIVLFTIIGLIGVFLLFRILSSKKTNMLVGIIHGSLGLLGMGILIFYISFIKGESPYVSLLIFLVAFFIGCGMLISKLTGKKYPLFIAVIHALTAVTGIYLLYVFWIKLM